MKGIRLDGTHPILKHGQCPRSAPTAEYRAWGSIKARCYNPKAKCYDRYGGRGIRMCDEWLNSFEDFFAYVGPRPSSKHSIDRYPDNDGNYEPGNVRWATKDEQQANRRNTIWVSLDGVKTTLVEACSILKVNRKSVWMRIARGETPDQAIANVRNVPQRKRNTNPQPKARIL